MRPAPPRTALADFPGDTAATSAHIAPTASPSTAPSGASSACPVRYPWAPPDVADGAPAQSPRGSRQSVPSPPRRPRDPPPRVPTAARAAARRTAPPSSARPPTRRIRPRLLPPRPRGGGSPRRPLLPRRKCSVPRATPTRPVSPVPSSTARRVSAPLAPPPPPPWAPCTAPTSATPSDAWPWSSSSTRSRLAAASKTWTGAKTVSLRVPCWTSLRRITSRVRGTRVPWCACP
mmetsp:Transcript_46227/g.90283  ORF Transcript_46227/g.90283 Transcript_46227/m.90283 type:complete len:233 (-) Transcript_46227:845-1543(-)